MSQEITRRNLLRCASGVSALGMFFLACGDSYEPPKEHHDRRYGSATAPVTIDMWFDFAGPFSARFHNDTLPTLESEYFDSGKATLLVRDFPLSSIHSYAFDAAVYTREAANRGVYRAVVEDLVGDQSQWISAPTIDGLTSVLAKHDIPLLTPAQRKEHEAAVRADLQEGIDSGIQGVPTFVFTSTNPTTSIVGAESYDIFKREIDSHLL